MSAKIEGFEHIHLHTDIGSLLDGYGMVDEYAERATQINQQFLCITDHGMMSAIPKQIRACEEYKISPVFGCELYINPLQPELSDSFKMTDFTRDLDDNQKKLLRKSYHLLAIAYTDKGYSNLVKLSSWGWLHGFYYKPRINRQILEQHKEGIIFTSCCYNSEIGQAFERGLIEGGPALAEAYGEEVLKQYIAMFGKENFYLEIMLLDFKKQKSYNLFIIKMSEKYGLKLDVANDCHYCKMEDSEMQRKMLMLQTGKTILDIQKAMESDEAADLFELQDSNLWMKSEEELNSKWEKQFSDHIEYDILAEAKRNTVEICRKAKGVQFDRSIKLPMFDDADQRFKDAIIAGFQYRSLPKTKVYLDRIKEEYELICNKGFSSYFLIQKMMTDEARRVAPQLLGWGSGSEAVGPARGSAAGALVCYCLGITDVDPIKHDLLFSRFLSPTRGGKTMKLRFSIDPLPSEEMLAT